MFSRTGLSIGHQDAFFERVIQLVLIN